MTEEQKLFEKLQRIEALFAGAATPGERDAAASARDRIRARLQDVKSVDPPIEYSFKLPDQWSRSLLVALLRRYGIGPYRYRRQRHTTVMARVPRRFVDETLWPEFVELNRTLRQYLAEVTERVICQAIAADASDVEERAEPAALTPGSGPSATTGLDLGTVDP